MREADTSRYDVKQCDVADSLTVGDLQSPQLGTSPRHGLETAITQPPAAAQHHPLNRQTYGRRVSAQNPRQTSETCPPITFNQSINQSIVQLHHA